MKKVLILLFAITVLVFAQQQHTETIGVRFDKLGEVTVADQDTSISDLFGVSAYNSLTFYIDHEVNGEATIKFLAGTLQDSANFAVVHTITTISGDTGWVGTHSILTPNTRWGKIMIIGGAGNDTLRINKMYLNRTPVIGR